MAIFSKPVRIHCSCYELGHCWTPHCVQATTDVAQDIFSEAIKIYGALYLVSFSGLEVQRKKLAHKLKGQCPTSVYMLSTALDS